MSDAKFMLPLVSMSKFGALIAPAAVRVKAPNPQMKPARPVHAPVIDNALFTDAFVPFVL